MVIILGFQKTAPFPTPSSADVAQADVLGALGDFGPVQAVNLHLIIKVAGAEGGEEAHRVVLESEESQS